MNFPDFANPALRRALGQAALEDGPATRQDVYRELLKSRLLVLTPGGDPFAGSGGVALKDTAIELFSLRSEDGLVGLPVFTDNEALTCWNGPDGLNGLLFDGAAVCEMALESGIDAVVLNPGGAACGQIQQPELGDLAAGRLPPC